MSDEIETVPLKHLAHYDAGMLRAAFVSLFWAIIIDRRKRGPLTLQMLADKLGKGKAEISRWFNGHPNWTVDTISSIAKALDVDLELRAIDRGTGIIFTPSGAQISAGSTHITTGPRIDVTSTSNPRPTVYKTDDCYCFFCGAIHDLLDESTFCVDLNATLVAPGAPRTALREDTEESTDDRIS